jgi:hypothetical protein
MKYVQDIPWYKNEYLKKDFTEEESLHYIFYFEKESLAHQNIKYIIGLKESHYLKISEWLGVSNDNKINYYIYPSLKEKELLMGDDSLGNAIWQELEDNIPKKFEIHVVYDKKNKFIDEHEDTHLLSLPWGLSIYLFCEGLAQYMENSFMGNDLHENAKRLHEENKLYSIEFLCSNDNWNKVEPVIIYPQVGSFVKFLIDIYGKEKFKAVYQNTSRSYVSLENLTKIKEIYSKDIVRLESEWLDYIK